ncbi:MAG: A/G-specific adenine glycosylase [Mariprofundaceae bacterium]
MFSARAEPSSARTESLLVWYAGSGRDLPWRRTRQPYAIWISEIMLQQTQVATVLPRYAAWFARFPDVAHLAKASLDDVLKAWEGLGYYRRARFIHAAAQHIVAEHGGCFPHGFDDILALPGIGRSTAGAIASFCFGATTAVLDGNVKRVLKRWHGAPAASDKQLWQLAEQAISVSGNPATWNQAMMELGATVCAPRNPDCAVCPVSADCASAFQAEAQVTKKKAVAVRDVHWRVHLHTCPDRGIWLTQRPDTGIWASLWTPPIIELSERPERAPCHIHLLTHRRLHLYTRLCPDGPAGDGVWAASLADYALPTGISRLLSTLDFDEHQLAS